MSHEQLKAAKQEREQLILDGLRGVGDENPVWRAVIAVVEHQAELADQMTLEPSLTPDVRSNYAGREWALKQLRSTLLIMRAQANKEKG